MLLLLTIGIGARAQQTPVQVSAHTQAKVAAPSGGVLPLDNTASIVRMMSTEPQFNRDFSFQNTTGTAITITDISLNAGDAGINLMSPANNTLPITIDPGHSISVRLGYFQRPSESGVDTLLFSTITGTTLRFPVIVTHITLTPEQNGLSHRQIALSVQPDDKRRSIQVILYSGYQGNIAIYTKDGLLVDEAKNVKSFLWHTTPGKKSYNENEYVVRVTCIDGGQTLTRSEKVTFASK